MKEGRWFYLEARGPLHFGAGLIDGPIDRPIIREKATGLPFGPGTSVKGAMREDIHFRLSREADDAARSDLKKRWEAVFGPLGDTGLYEGALVPPESLLLFLPVISFQGTRALVTCPFVLGRFHRQRREFKGVFPADTIETAPEVPDVGAESAIAGPGLTFAVNGVEWVELCDYALRQSSVEKQLKLRGEWASLLGREVFPDNQTDREVLARDFVIVPDPLFAEFCEIATDVRPRVKIGDEGVADEQKFWLEESLPEESVLFGTMLLGHQRKNAAAEVTLDDAYKRGAHCLYVAGDRGRARLVLP